MSHCENCNRLRTALDDAESRIENAAQAMSETARSWEQRCHSIVAALGFDFGGFETNVPEVGSYFQVMLQRKDKEIFDLVSETYQLKQEIAELKKTTEPPANP